MLGILCQAYEGWQEYCVRHMRDGRNTVAAKNAMLERNLPCLHEETGGMWGWCHEVTLAINVLLVFP